MNSNELRRYLKKLDKSISFKTHKGGSGHQTARRGDRTTQIPMHGSKKELGTGLVKKILKDLGLN